MNNSMKYILATLIILVGVVGVTFYSCEKEEITPNGFTPEIIQELDANVSNTDRIGDGVEPNAEEHISPEDFLNENYEFIEPEFLCGKAVKKEIFSESGKMIGVSYVFNTDKNLYVWLITETGYIMKSAQMHLASDPKQFPITSNGKLDYTKFKYSTPDDQETGRMIDFKIPLKQLNGSSTVAVTTEFQNPEGTWLRAWVGQTIFQGAVNTRIFRYEEQECKVGPNPPIDEVSNNAHVK